MMKNIKLLLLLMSVLICGKLCKNIVVYAEDSDEQWITIYFATHEYQQGEDVDYVIKKIHPGEKVDFPTPYTLGLSESRRFSQWFAYDMNRNFIGIVDETTTFTQSVYVIPQYITVEYELNVDNRKYIVKLNFDDDKLYEKLIHYISVDRDETQDLHLLLKENHLLDLERDGYTFLGWFTEKEGGKEIDDTVYVKSDMTIYAHWKLNDGIYKLEYSKNYNMRGNEDPYQSEWAETVPKLPILKREGYLFVGWYYSANFYSPNYKVKKGDTLSRNTRIFAHWEKINVKKASIKKIKTAEKNKIKVSIKKVKNADGYQIMCSKNKKFKKKTSKTYTSKKTTKAIKIRKNMKYIKVRAYRIDSAGKKVYGKWSKVKRIKSK